jgi:hypothetical protein
MKTARVTSIEAIRTFQAALRKYQETLKDCLSLLSVEIDRAIQWIESDRMLYWPHQVRESSDALTEALNNLERKRLCIDSSDRPSCYDEKKAVERAKRRHQYCEQRLANAKRWLHVLRHDSEEFQGLIAKLGHFVENDLPRAIAKLDQFSVALEKYAATAQIPTAKEKGF